MRFDVLSRDLLVFGSHFLEASAGTGKTFAIEHFVTRLLIESDAPLLIEQILVVTFTKAATRELKLRIRRNIARTKEELLSGNITTDYLKAIACIKTAIERLDAALICYDAAQIYTLHGFCHRILKEFAFEANSAIDVSDPDEKEHISLLEQMVKDYLKEGVTAPHYSPVQISAVLKKKQGDPRKMISSLVDLVANGKEIAAIPSHAELMDSFLNELRALPEIDASHFLADLSLLVPHYKQMTGDEIPSQMQLLSSILSSKGCTKEQFDQLLAKDLFLEKMRDDNKKVRAKFPEPSALSYPGLVEKIQRKLLPPIEIAKDPTRTFLRLAKDLQEKSRTLLEKREKFSPDALLLKVQQALTLPRFTECVRQKYRAAIVDEFQDTDPVQWDIFQQLFLSKIDAVCLVGDPKQSIYAFRNADLYVYLDAAKAMGESAKKHLDTNFRSTAPLVEALNLLFSKAKEGWMGLPGRKETLEVIPVKSGASGLSQKFVTLGQRESSRGSTIEKGGNINCNITPLLDRSNPGALTRPQCNEFLGKTTRITPQDADAPVEFFIAVDKKGRARKFPTEEMLESKVFPYIASEIVKLHNQKGIEYHEIAILIKDRFQGQDVIDYLKKCGIPASTKRGSLITETSAYFAMKELLSAVCSPSDMSKVKAALCGPFIKWDEKQLMQGLMDGKAKMLLLSSLLFEKGFGPFFQSLLNTSWSQSQKPLLQELFSRGDLPLYLDLRKLSELLIEEEIERGLKAEGFITYLNEIAMEGHRDESRLKVSAQEEKGSVTVMTTHMSKGLEFEAVFALGIGGRHKISEQLAVKKENSSILTIFDAADPASMLAVEEIDAEKMRQLYVALTRAKRHLYIPLMIEEDCKGIATGEASPIELFFARIAGQPQTHDSLYRTAESLSCTSVTQILDGLSPLIGYRILQEAPFPDFEKNSSLESEIIPPLPLCLPQNEEKLLSFSSLAKKDHAFESIKPPQDAPLSPHTMPMGSDTGHLLHLLFEKIFKRSLHHPLNESALSLLINEEIAFSPLEPWGPILLPWILSLLTKKMTAFSLCDIPQDQLQQEMEFFFATEQGMMKGFADLFFEFEGKYYLLDWKSNYLGPSDADYSREKMAEAMRVNEYDMQASIYRDALERYVKLFDNRSFSECFGGAIYYFVRGGAIYHFIPESYSELTI